MKKVDCIEIVNGRTFSFNVLERLPELLRFKKPFVCGSDAHFVNEVGRCFMSTPKIDSLTQILRDAGKREIVIDLRNAITYEALSQAISVVKRGDIKRVKNIYGTTKAWLRNVMKKKPATQTQN
ncbi:MAG: hypothetical protein NWF14_09215 [Candidatus Bathyarchaeota archaeon]|nr:hypothetical protein [Candidatus Bathyarchaeota archaeon]